MFSAIQIFTWISIVQLSGANIDSPFTVDPEELQLKEISDNVRQVSGAVMGLTEYVMEIRNELKTIRSDISESKSVKLPNTTMRPLTYYSGRPQKDPAEVRRQSLELADKVEKLLSMDQSPEVDLAKEELKRTVEKNFLRMLAAILVTGPAHTQERSDDIFKLMRSVLNGELDFTPVVQRLPLILRDSETNQFVNLLITLRESERGGSSFRQGLFTSVENTVQMSGRKQVLNFPIPSSPVNTPIGTIPNPNRPINQINPIINRPYIPNPNYQNHQNYQGSLLQQANSNTNTINRIPPNINNFNPNNVNTNNNNNNINNNGQINGNENGNPQDGMNGQNNQLPSINSLIDAMSQTNQLIKEIPTLVEGLQTLVESLEGLIG